MRYSATSRASSNVSGLGTCTSLRELRTTTFDIPKVVVLCCRSEECGKVGFEHLTTLLVNSDFVGARDRTLNWKTEGVVKVKISPLSSSRAGNKYQFCAIESKNLRYTEGSCSRLSQKRWRKSKLRHSIISSDPIYDENELEREWTKSLQSLLTYLNSQTEAEHNIEVTFTGYDGGKWAAKRVDITLQLNYDSIHHRAHIQTLIRQQGLEPDFVDFIGTKYRNLA